MNSEPLYERYRPRSLDEVIGQPAAVKKLRRFVDSNTVAGRAFWLAGRSGNGKTTLARILAASVAEPLFIDELDAIDLTAARLRQILDRHRVCPLFGNGHAVIINEAHGIRDAKRLLGVLEPIPHNVVWIFTTTIEGQLTFDGMADAGPLLSRVAGGKPIKLETRGVAEAFAQRALEIAQAEGLDGQPLSAYKELVNQARGNMRAVLQAIEAGEMLKP